MKKLLTITLLVVTGLLFVPNADAQVYPSQDRWGNQDQDWNRGRQRRNHGYENRTYIRNEYRYVRYGRVVYRETYRTLYHRSGRIVNRVLIRRERVRDYDRNRSGFRFNIYIPF